MAKSNHIFDKKKGIFLKSIMTIGFVMAMMTGILTVCLLITQIGIRKTQKASDELKKSITLMNQELSDIREEQDEYETKLQILEQQLSQYQPVIIPDSMKK